MLLLLAVAAAVLFLFTTQLVRLALRQIYPDFTPSIERASLGISGSVTVLGLRLNEPGAPATLLLSADRLRVHFGWRDLLTLKVETVDARGLNVHLRSDERRPLTLLALVPPESEEPAFWFDRLTADGEAHFDRPGGVALPIEKMPLDLDVRMEGSRERPDRRICLALGEAGRSPHLLVQGRANDQRILVEQASVRGLETVVAADDLRQWGAALPPQVRGPVEVRLAAIEASGSVQLAEPAMPIRGSIEVRGFSAAGAEAADGKPAKLADFSTAFAFELQGGRPLETLHIADGYSRARTIQYQQHDVRDVEAAWGLKAGRLAVTELRLRAFKGDIRGGIVWNLLAGTVDSGDLTIEHLDLNEAKVHLSPGGPEVAGSLSGNAHVSTRADSKQIQVDGEFSIRELAATVPADLAHRYLPRFAGRIGGPVRLTADRMCVKGRAMTGDPLLPVNASGTIDNLSVHARGPDGADLLSLKRLSTGFGVQISAMQPSLSTMSVSMTEMRFESLAAGPADVRDFTGSLDLSNGLLRATDVKFRNGEAAIEGSGSFDLVTRTLRQAMLDVSGLDAALLSRFLPDGPVLEGTIAGKVQAAAELDEQGKPLRYSGGVTLRDLSLSAASNEVRILVPGLPEGVSGPLWLSAEGIDLKAVVAMNDPKRPLSISGNVRGFSFSAPEAPKEAALAMERLSTEFSMRLPLVEPSLASFSGESDSAQLASLKYGSFHMRDLAVQWSLRDQELHVGRASWRMYKADIEGRLRMNMETGVLSQAKFGVKHLDLHDMASTLLPGKMDASGQVSGTIDLHSELDPETRRPKPLGGEVKLASDGPGKLMIGDVKPLQEALTEGKSQELTDVILAQLKNYPYETGSVTLTTMAGMPEIVLSFTRKPVQAGEPGHDVPMDYEGRKVRANYTVQISRVVIAMPQQTIASILLRASGLRSADPKQRR